MRDVEGVSKVGSGLCWNKSDVTAVRMVASLNGELRLCQDIGEVSVCLYVCLSVCLSACLPACLSVCLPACLPICLSAYPVKLSMRQEGERDEARWKNGGMAGKREGENV